MPLLVSSRLQLEYMVRKLAILLTNLLCLFLTRILSSGVGRDIYKVNTTGHVVANLNCEVIENVVMYKYNP